MKTASARRNGGALATTAGPELRDGALAAWGGGDALLAGDSADLREVRRPVEARLRDVERELLGMVPSGFDSLDEIGDHVFARSGKLLRPTLLLLADGLTGRSSPEAITLAAAVELMHVATLVHDDAVDHSAERRGLPTVNHRWTHQVAIITGDYLYSKAVVEVAALGDLEPVSILARTANRMTIGEMQQLVLHDGLHFTRTQYYRLCEYKTASLMSAACELGALCGAPELRKPLRDFGRSLGMAFQIVDDLFDYTSSSEIMGKPPGQDLQEHKVTLPLIAALPDMNREERNTVETLFADLAPTGEAVREVIDLVEMRGGVAAARSEACTRVAQARAHLAGLPGGPCLDALRCAADYAVERAL